jgi:hypothetical protein
VRQDSDISTQGTPPVYVIDMSEEQRDIKIVQTVEKFTVIYDYSSLGHSNKEQVDKAFDKKTGISPDRFTSRALKRTHHFEHTTH